MEVQCNRSTNIFFRVCMWLPPSFALFIFLHRLGLPHPSTFPFHSLSAQITGMRPAAGETHQQKTKTGSSDLVTVPLVPQPDKIESLTASLQVKKKQLLFVPVVVLDVHVSFSFSFRGGRIPFSVSFTFLDTICVGDLIHSTFRLSCSIQAPFFLGIVLAQAHTLADIGSKSIQD